ncbi:ABC transporter ATP-binding protein [Actinacidiphila acididurans]|uniref:ABC transporter ATP-binding protein n=1 Tax=Actinacidiphila acididurans TaxID=2784346 RepID=A0ABS2U049_9ACTN|nr:ABC transporter ATP-binding protein [Actinacidiphila acididurans]MBM9508121.1 ABC transporter ATP-binding protein [Actinacidiphila acididurans]
MRPSQRESAPEGAWESASAGVTEGVAGTAPGAGEPVLSVEGLRITVGAGRAEAVRDVSFTVRAGEAVGVVGESGSGKTLTCRSLLGVLPPGCAVSAGSARLAGTELTGLGRREWERLRGVRLAAVFQDPASYLNPALTVGRQLAEPLRVRLGLGRAQARARAVELFGSVGLHRPAEVYHRYPHELSGGMLQRVLIAIAVACDPQLLVADEATTALDTVVQAEVLALLARLRRERALALLLVTHDLAVVAEVTDRVLVFYAGQIVEDGPTAEVVRRPAHPYTAALLRVASAGDWHRRDLSVIPGRPPETGATPPGCRFADRCAFAQDRCRTQEVPLTAVVRAPGDAADDAADGARRVRCLRAAELAPALADVRIDPRGEARADARTPKEVPA